MTRRPFLLLCLPVLLAGCPTPSMMMPGPTPEPVADAGAVPSAPLTVSATVDGNAIAVSWTLPAELGTATQVVIAR
ncbi:MAG: hypothetical protein MUC96_34875, partial [Myxococcaceae bacterium]|nr:hypothetical protein [Myxococcaceae bacterium]